MLILPDPPILSHEEIRKKSFIFLRTFHPTRDIPIPIEKIIDLKLKLHIIGIPGLLKFFEVDGFLLSNLKEIWVDNDLYTRRHPRYFFTLAHEIGHYFIHKKIYKQLKIKDTSSWKELIRNPDEEKIRWFEYQAYAFAGLVLVPLRELKRQYGYRLLEIKKAGGKTPSAILPVLIELLSKDFLVSRAVIKKRLEKEKILPQDLHKELLIDLYPFNEIY